MSNYVYAVCDDYGNHLHTISGASLRGAQEKIIEEYREEYEIDDEFNNYREFCEYMSLHDIMFSELSDVETL